MAVPKKRTSYTRGKKRVTQNWNPKFAFWAKKSFSRAVSIYRGNQQSKFILLKKEKND